MRDGEIGRREGSGRLWASAGIVAGASAMVWVVRGDVPVPVGGAVMVLASLAVVHGVLRLGTRVRLEVGEDGLAHKATGLARQRVAWRWDEIEWVGLQERHAGLRLAVRLAPGVPPPRGRQLRHVRWSVRGEVVLLGFLRQWDMPSGELISVVRECAGERWRTSGRDAAAS